ncbi:hypothetical protein V511_01370 [Mesotoga sp. Brook.08.YT.4.2.5.1]|nr:hypothetical protein V511_01370 [Mesotoga sp. Brook.08.YT.4.2.5.1]RAO95596.1 hypothetical protein M388_03645 [Mesotoga sp. Brook.08.YT.4.2.5.4.]RDI90774.1 hypothetical protein Q502_12695 [Mesotoga sp. Brook.08.YT.4.2.5.2.]
MKRKVDERLLKAKEVLKEDSASSYATSYFADDSIIKPAQTLILNLPECALSGFAFQISQNYS